MLQGGAVRPDRLEALLAQKVPTASRCCVAQFTAAFLADRRLGGGGGHEGALGCLYKVAKLDDEDHLFSFPEFLDRFSELYSHPPVVRMLAWCCYAVRASGVMEKMDLSAILGYEYVDQIGLPFLLESPSEKGHAQGRAFSWKVLLGPVLFIEGMGMVFAAGFINFFYVRVLYIEHEVDPSTHCSVVR